MPKSELYYLLTTDHEKAALLLLPTSTELATLDISNVPFFHLANNATCMILLNGFYFLKKLLSNNGFLKSP